MTQSFQKIGIIGAGAWGTALAAVLRRAGRDVLLWAHNPAVADIINSTHENSVHLSGIALDPAIRATSLMDDLADSDAFLFVPPAQKLREVATQLRPATTTAPIILACKGIELGSQKMMSDVAAEVLPTHSLAVLSGPGFAEDVARGLPTAVTLACADTSLGGLLAQSFAAPAFRPYLSDDIIGVELGGALKNVMAIACGIVAGKKFGDGARAALITRGLTEMSRLAIACGGKTETLTGLSGLGDLVLTASSSTSRNTSLGIALGQGQSLSNILGPRTSVTEGVATSAACVALAKKHTIDMPIAEAVDAIVNHHAPVDATIAALLSRPLKAETSTPD